MAKQDKNTLYSWAKPGWKPLATQIKQWYDSFWHKDEKIPIASVEGLTEALNAVPSNEATTALIAFINGETVVFNADGTYTIPDGKTLVEILVKPSAAISLRIGSAAGLDDLVPEPPEASAVPEWITLKLYANGERTIYINGITAQTTIIFYKR